MSEEIKTKVCVKCGRELPIGAFGKYAKSKDGLQPECKECRNEAARLRYQEQRSMLKRAKSENGLKDYTPRELIEELRSRGYKGKLTYTIAIEV